MSAQDAQPDLFSWRFEVVREPVRTSSETSSNRGSEVVRSAGSEASEPAEPAIAETGRISGFSNDFAGSNHLVKFPNDYAGSRGSPLGGRTTEPVHSERAPYQGGVSLTLPPPWEGSGHTDGIKIPNQAPNHPNHPNSATPGPAIATSRAPNLRPYQLAAIAGVREQHARGVKRTLLVQATGTGKTVVFSEWIRERLAATGKRALVLAHRTELLEQAAEAARRRRARGHREGRAARPQHAPSSSPRCRR
jgi:hypothetical protein